MSQNLQVELSREFDAPAEKVFDAWLDADNIGRWLFATPDGSMKKVEVDPRVGGRFQIDEQRGELIARHFGEYLVIERPDTLVFGFTTDPEEKPTVVTIRISAHENRCSLTLSHPIAPEWAGWRDQTVDSWATILQGLANTLGSALD